MFTNFAKILIELSRNHHKINNKVIFSAKLVTNLVIPINLKRMAFQSLCYCYDEISFLGTMNIIKSGTTGSL